MSYDILLQSDRDIPHNTALVTGMEIVAQRVETRLRTFLGEWILDKTQGMPFLDWVQEKPPDVDVIGLFVRQQIETTPGVRQVLEFSGTFTPETQTLAYSGSVVVDDEQEPITFEVLPLGDAPGNTSPAIVFVSSSGRIVAGHPIVRA